ncbi:hypothetical protein SAMN05444274_11249 [Mariniphaga anaerophila]|uniref:Uncharacterized protein n=1 Tax=Mariniphaga anaerophila TaxID=1484053 RepID=A0A1M5FH62_9BACT|nr:hypothetical protein [Mariniphaga anaerophila]SHF90481.1 hypothetical protein SAMN05444274_11249 [Mariniphaga anaerophila]
MKLFSRILSVLVLPLLIIGSTNYLIDPDYTLRKNYLQKAALALANGKLLSGPINANGRLLKKEWIEQLQKSPEVLILGSSRTMGVSKNLFNGKQIFNASVTNCTFQDMYAFVDLMGKKTNTVPKKIIICCDQWLLGNSFTEKRWLYNRKNFINLLKKSGNISPSAFPRKWELQKEWIKELFSVRYFIRSIKLLGKPEKFEIRNTVVEGKAMLLPDGSRILPSQIANPNPKIAEEKAKNYFYASSDEVFTRLDPAQCQLFENLIGYLQEKNCKITLFIPPYHPLTWQLMHNSESHSGIFEANDYLLNIAERNKICVIGATNPSVLNLSPADFYDGVHLKTEALFRLFSVTR